MQDNLKYFHISLGFEIKDRPEWLKVYREKYDKPYAYHVTLKNETSIKVSRIEILKSAIKDITDQFSSQELEMIFDQVEFSRTQKGFCIMVFAKEDQDVIRLRNEIFKEVKSFGKVRSQEHRRFDNDFRPHITIARHLNQKEFESAKKELPRNIRFKIEPKKITLSVVNSPNIQERLDEENRTYFYFK